MGLLKAIVGVVVVGALAVVSGISSRKEKEEEERRKNTPCNFDDGISSEEFTEIVMESAKHLSRLIEVNIEGPVVTGKFESQSGITEWPFTLDFNAYGYITGQYWLTCENTDSHLPTRFGDLINRGIRDKKSQNNSQSEPVPII